MMRLHAAMLALACGGTLCGQAAPPARTHYRGRAIAQTMHYLGAPWLIRESRERQEGCAMLLGALQVQPGDIACDLGCGNGYYTLKLAAMVGAKGKVLAVDIQKQMLGLLRLRAKKTDVGDRIQTVLGTQSDPKLAPNSVDLTLMIDVYHELSHPETTLIALRKSLRPGGRIALAEFRTEDPDVPIKRLHKMSKRQILREWIPNGFRVLTEFDALPWQHLMFFGRAVDDAKTRKARAQIARIGKFMRSLAIDGGYATSYTPGEKQSKPSPKTNVQVSSTTDVGAAQLRAFWLTGERRHFAAAQAAGRALVTLQEDSGNIPGTHGVRAARFLLELRRLIPDRWLEQSCTRMIAATLRSQAKDGAWPQRQRDRLAILLDWATRENKPELVPTILRGAKPLRHARAADTTPDPATTALLDRCTQLAKLKFSTFRTSVQTRPGNTIPRAGTTLNPLRIDKDGAVRRGNELHSADFAFALHKLCDVLDR